ncbi:hypothetical protein MW732_004285 [Enterobacter hormaechei]|uniref:hypothetical protein n=1 Tax=Enterobacter hormaechei TaxID=158836 RepID=UPI00079A1E81|nr:hypothetical protein [Enterobacter hormaechei]EJB6975024.1 hypothetical protein [Enterobacter hormaechei]SAF62473.1 Uncharacterised protein [Enterobacter hormaechei]
MHNSIDSILNDRSENSAMFEDFIQAIFNDYDSGSINRNQAALAIKCAFVLIENGNASAAIDWIKTGRKHIRTIK